MKVNNNIFVRGMSGQVGNQFVVRKGKGGQTIIANKPSFSQNRTFQPEQLAHQDAFREAIAYAKTAKDNPFYVALAEGTTKSAFNVAVADWFKKPMIHEINRNGWSGEWDEFIHRQDPPLLFTPCQFCAGNHRERYCLNLSKLGF